MSVLVEFGIDQLGLEARQRRADGADDVGFRRGGEAAAGGFGESVGLQHGEAEGLDVAADLGVEARASGAEVADVGAELGVDFFEDDLAEIEAQLLRCGAEGEQDAEDLLGEASFFGDLAEDALVDEIEELGDAAEDGDAALAQGERQLLGVERIEKDDLAAVVERQEEVGHLGQHVEERQDSEQGVSGTDGDEPADALELGGEIAVGEHDALGIAGGSRGVDDGRDIVGLDGSRGEIRRRVEGDFKDAGQAGVRASSSRGELNGVSGGGLLGDGFFGNMEAALVGEEQGCAGVGQELGDLRGGEGGVEGNGDVAAGDDSQVGGDPGGTVEGEDGAARAAGDAASDAGAKQPVSHGVGDAAELAVGEALDGVAVGGGGDAGERRRRYVGSRLPLNFDRRSRRPALHGLQEATVKHRVSRQQDTRKMFEREGVARRESAEIAPDKNAVVITRSTKIATAVSFLWTALRIRARMWRR